MDDPAAAMMDDPALDVFAMLGSASDGAAKRGGPAGSPRGGGGGGSPGAGKVAGTKRWDTTLRPDDVGVYYEGDRSGGLRLVHVVQIVEAAPLFTAVR